MSAIHPSLIGGPGLVVGLPASSAHVLSALFASGYVGSIYLSKIFAENATRPTKLLAVSAKTVPAGTAPVVTASDEDVDLFAEGAPRPGDRDHPATIRRRMAAVSLATLGSISALLAVVKQANGLSLRGALVPTLRLMGIPTALNLRLPTVDSSLPYLLAPALLFGPLVAMYLDRSLPMQGEAGSIWGRVKGIFRDWSLIEWRNYVVGPITEELVFRSCIVGASLLARPALSTTALIFATPLWFGIAHAHHAWENFKKNGGDRNAAIHAIAMSSFQLTYTTLFGWFASYLFLRTGSVIPPTVAHMYCNLMGIYPPGLASNRHPKKKNLLRASYVVGIAGFTYGLRLV